jgi:hypothetical protein
MTDGDALRLNSVVPPNITNVDVPGFWPGGYVTVLLECDGIFIILLEDVVADVLPLCLQEHLDPNGVGKVIANANKFNFSRALCI